MRPLIVAPDNRANLQCGAAIIERIVKVVHKPILAFGVKDAAMARADNVLLSFQNQRTATGEHGDSGGIRVWAGDFFAAADHDFIGAVDAAAAVVERDEEIEIIVVTEDVRSFDGSRFGAAGE